QIGISSFDEQAIVGERQRQFQALCRARPIDPCALDSSRITILSGDLRLQIGPEVLQASHGYCREPVIREPEPMSWEIRLKARPSFFHLQDKATKLPDRYGLEQGRLA